MSRFSRNNVLHLWPYTIVDLERIGAKQFYPKFGTGQIDHISKLIKYTGKYTERVNLFIHKNKLKRHKKTSMHFT